ncbi:N-acetyltransferase family protein [Halosimplex amylolyticum]|uniref:GNAT family N-acetyltransferase n=1 Tax=Halosimplex amylolyticum TaxID=3396616 RepID=UPI003F566CDB
MSELHVRPFRPGDGERVRELNRVAMAETPEWVPDAPDADLEDVRGHYLDAGGEFLVCEVERSETSKRERGTRTREQGEGEKIDTGNLDDEIVAMGAYEPLDGWMAEQFDSTAGTAELTRVRVDPAAQGRGFGTRVVEELEHRARCTGYRAFVLNTGADNEQARGFYESHGYSLVRETTVEFEGATLDLALYWSRLDG